MKPVEARRPVGQVCVSRPLVHESKAGTADIRYHSVNVPWTARRGGVKIPGGRDGYREPDARHAKRSPPGHSWISRVLSPLVVMMSDEWRAHTLGKIVGGDVREQQPLITLHFERAADRGQSYGC